MATIATLSCILLSFSVSYGQLMHSTIVFSPSELIGDNKITNATGSIKSALRYGFHRTSECNNYEKAFLCIQKCVDNGFDVAYSDKYCFCTCYVKKQKAKYTPLHQFNRTKWKLGTPKTTKPAWIQKLADQLAELNKSSTSAKLPKVILEEDNTTNISDENENAQLLGGQNITDNRNVSDLSNLQITTDITNTTDDERDEMVSNSDIISNDQNTSNGTNEKDTQDISGTTNATETENVSGGTNGSDSENPSYTTNATDSQQVTGGIDSTDGEKGSEINATNT